MKILKEKLIHVRDIATGEVFEHENTYYLLAEVGGPARSCIDINTGISKPMHPLTAVRFVEGYYREGKIPTDAK